MAVGSFPGLAINFRETRRAPINPIDKSTIVSIYPRQVKIVQYTITPSRYVVPPGSEKEPSLYVVEPASWWKDVDESQPLLEIPQSSNLVANAIVNDFCNGLLGCNMSSARPGIFWLPGEVDIVTLNTKYVSMLEDAKAKQRNYYLSLIKHADTFWARTNGSPLAINDDMRLAARELNLAHLKDWMKDFTMIEKTNCKACGFVIDPAYPMCANCKTIWDQERYNALGLKQA